MGRTSQRREAELVRVVRDASGAAILLVAGSAPLVYRVLGPKPKKVTKFEMEAIDGDFIRAGVNGIKDDGCLPTDLLIYSGAWMIAEELLKPVDILWAASGSSYYGTMKQGYYLWQSKRPLIALSLLEVRGALASAWVQRWRSPRGDQRAILLRS
jgi:hypothetical protein